MLPTPRRYPPLSNPSSASALILSSMPLAAFSRAFRFSFFFFSSRRRHTRCLSDWSSDVCSSDLGSRRVRRIGIRIAQCRLALLVIGYIQPDELFKVAIRIENLNTSVASIGHVHVSLLVDLHVMRVPELTGPRAV